MRSVLLLTLTALTSCSVGMRARPFVEVFPDISVLVTTADPEHVLLQLGTVELPSDLEHRDQVLRLLRGSPTISAAHLALLTRAVALPQQITYATKQGRWTYPVRGQSENAAFIDKLLTEGADKVSDIDGRWFGELIGISQSDTTMLLLAERFCARVDDGSDRALDQMLAGMPGSPAAMPFLTNYMVPQGRLDGERGWYAFTQLSFDSERSALLGVLLTRDNPIDGDRMVAIMQSFSFDSGRTKAFQLLTAGNTESLSADSVQAAIATFSFDSGRQAAIGALAKKGALRLDDGQLLAIAELCSFDRGRLDCVRKLAPFLVGEANGQAATQLLGTFTFDSERLEAVELMADRWLALPVDIRRQMLATFSFDSNRSKATMLLMR